MEPLLDLSSFVDKIADKTWGEIDEFLPRIASKRPFQLDETKYQEFFSKVESKYLTDDSGSIPDFLLVELGYVFGMNRVGSPTFWKKLTNQVSSKASKIPVELVARFIYGTTFVGTVDPRFWDEVENGLQQNPEILNVNILSYLMPSMLRNLRGNSETESAPLLTKESSIMAILDEQPLWSTLRDNADSFIDEADVMALSEICTSLAAVNYADEGFWISAQERFFELKEKMDEIQILSIVESFGQVKQGNSDFWQEIESYTLANHETLQTSTITSMLTGFAGAGEGSFRFWNELSNYLFDLNLPADHLGNLIVSLGNYDLLSESKWQALEEKALEKLAEFSLEGILNLIVGFGNRGKGSQELWNSIEEQLLSLNDIPQKAQLVLYCNLKMVNKLTPDLASHFHMVSESGDKVLEMMRMAQEAQAKEEEEEA